MSNSYWSLSSIRIVDNYQEWKQWYKKNEASRGTSDDSPHGLGHRFDFRSKFQGIRTLLTTGHIDDDFLGQLVFDVRVRQFSCSYDSVRKCSSSHYLATIVINGFLWWVPIRIVRTAVNHVVKFFSDWRCISNWYVGATRRLFEKSLPSSDIVSRLITSINSLNLCIPYLLLDRRLSSFALIAWFHLHVFHLHPRCPDFAWHSLIHRSVLQTSLLLLFKDDKSSKDRRNPPAGTIAQFRRRQSTSSATNPSTSSIILRPSIFRRNFRPASVKVRDYAKTNSKSKPVCSSLLIVALHSIRR